MGGALRRLRAGLQQLLMSAAMTSQEESEVGTASWWDQSEEPKRKPKSLSPSTTGRAVQILSKIMAWAVKAGKIRANPCIGITVPRIERKEMRFIDTAEICRLANPRYRVLILVAAFGGLRIGDLAGLRRSRGDLDKGRIQVPESVVEVAGQITTGPPKTRAGRRSVTLSSSVVTEPDRHIAPVHFGRAGCLCLLSTRRRPIRGSEVASTLLGSCCCRGPSIATDTALVATHGRGLVEQDGCQRTGGLTASRSHLGQLHTGPLRTPLSRT
jgi:integrase